MCRPDNKWEATLCTEAVRQKGPSWKQGCAQSVAGEDHSLACPAPGDAVGKASRGPVMGPGAKARLGGLFPSKPMGSHDGLSAALIRVDCMFSKTPDDCMEKG